MKMLQLFSTVLTASWMMTPPAIASEIEGVFFSERLTVHDTELRLQGKGLLRYRMLIKGYVAALYLDESFRGGATPNTVLAETPRRLEIEYFWDIPRDAFARATIEGIGNNTTPEVFERLRASIQEMNGLYEDIAAGDRYTITYVPGHGTELRRNGRALGTVQGAEFSSALFAIWLGERPLDETLRAQLLAGR